MNRPYLLVLLILPLLFGGHALAEKADADLPTNVEANQMAYDDVKQINIFTGNVVLTRGTLVMRAEKMVVSQDPAGYQYGTMYAAPGGFTTFRQKRDGGPDLWIEGRAADRIEYDSKTEIAKFYSKARVRLLDGQKVTDEVEGEFISYDSKTEFYSVNNTATGQSKPGAGRIRAIIQPRTNEKQEK
ncbi:lipopolysaccharide transport periplasmic protein LptA [Oxalobacteraceae bacterium R-40]|uniref:Lipopolysaccharide export system protein LptA n=1 Tax=Keguizhuia sedimenti TaxID=3064264 RepID=A0ABU1BPR0_9BURK|nr:lipopolysaccharide transport periplasmic protein LptA [Oxalobacteraceae bacterium R-40]